MRTQGTDLSLTEGWSESQRLLGWRFMKSTFRFPLTLCLGIFGLGLFGVASRGFESAAPPAPATTPKLEYNRDIRPIFAENCFACHGPDGAARKGDLRLDRAEDAIQSGVLAPGKPAESDLVTRLFEANQKKVMPPPHSHKVLTPKQKQTLKDWIAQGAEYQLHWSFLAPKRAELPPVKHKGWVRSPMDQYILAGLEAKGLSPAPEADRRTLARRLSLDLNGVPPDVMMVEAFVKDPSPDAYEKFVDQLLAKPQWGEHRGRYWLDAARYADSHGIHFDNFREMWSYREWVVRAMNQNMPFNQFTLEQLAGDLLPDATLDQQIATGFNRCNITTSEGGAISEEYLVLYARDRTETTAQVFLGLTAGCAVCHDHKFDPISTKEFYSLSAFFNNTTQAAMDGNAKDTPPIIPVPKSEDREGWTKVVNDLAKARKVALEQKKEAQPRFDQWLASTKAEGLRQKLPTNGLVLHAPFNEGKGNTVEVSVSGKKRTIEATGTTWVAEKGKAQKDLSFSKPGGITLPDVGDFERDQKFSFGGWVFIPRGITYGAIFAKMEAAPGHRGWDLWFENGRFGSHIVSTWPNNAIKVIGKQSVNQGTWHHVFLTYDGSSKASGVKLFVDGTPQELDVPSDSLSQSLHSKVPLRFARREVAESLANIRLSDVRLYDRTLANDEVAQLGKLSKVIGLLARNEKNRKPEEKTELFEWWMGAVDTPSMEVAKRIESLDRQEKEIRARGTIAHIMVEKSMEAQAFILARGEYDKRKDPVVAATPGVLHSMPKEFPKNRLGLARWILKEGNPLTDRVTVNRFWQEVFGTGIVRTTGDFGITGELPSHPELLDFLALDLRDKRYDIKAFFKMLVTSATYRQAAVTTREKAEKDPANRMLSRGPRFRMDAEMIRDSALASSGLLVQKIGGPSVKPYMPEGVWEAVAMIGSNTRDYRADTGEGLYRRSMYTFWKRSAPPASMEIFNAPNRETCTVRRERTNTPLQALVTLNDIQFVEAARVLAQKAILEGGTTEDGRLNLMTNRLFSRDLNPAERKVVLTSLAELSSHYQTHQADAKKLILVGESKADQKIPAELLASWTMVANSLMNLDEYLCK